MTPHEPPRQSIPFALVGGRLLFKPEVANHFLLLAGHWNLDTAADNFAEAFQAEWSRSLPRIGRAWREDRSLRFYVSQPLKSPEMSELAAEDNSPLLRARLAGELASLV